MKTAGQAGTNTSIIDDSIIIGGGLRGVIGVSGITERGDVNTPRLIGTWKEYQQYFGGLIDESDFPLYCQRALDAGAQLKVNRVAHYSNIADKTTLVGTKATLTKAQASAVTGVGATSVYTYTASGVAGNSTIISADLGAGGVIELGRYTIEASPTVTTAAAGAKAAINAATSLTGFTANNTAGALTVTAPVSVGAAGNSYTLIVTNTGSTVGSVTTAFGAGTLGVTALAINVFTLTAKSIGTWANSALYVTIRDAANGVADEYDIEYGLVGYPDLGGTIRNVPESPTTQQRATINATLKLFQITAATTFGVLATSYFTSGTEDKSLITDLDHIGNNSQSIGIYAFNGDKDIVKIAVPAKAVPAIDSALLNYAVTAGNFRALLRTPVGLDSDSIVDYREGTGAYAHAALDSWYGTMWTGGLRILDPETLEEREISEIGDVAAAYCRKATSASEFFAVAGQRRGRVTNALGVVYDLGAGSRKLNADNVSIHGVNAVIDHPTFGVVLWDNMTLQKADTLLKYDSIADLMIYLIRGIPPIVETELFEPNDIQTWKTIYRKVKYFMEPLKTARAIFDWRYEGDQDIDDVAQATVNTPENIDAGAYKFRLFVKPINALKFIQIDIIVKNSGASLEIVSA